MSQGRRENNRNSKKLIKSGVTGVVKRYIDKGAYGFITEDDTYRDVFFHISAVSKSTRRLGDPIQVGDEVLYDLYLAPKGYRAESVRILNQEGYDSDDSYNDNLYRRKESDWSRQGEGNKGEADGRRRRRPRRRDGRDRNRRAESVERGYSRRDEDNHESDDGGRREPSRDRTPRSHFRSENGSTSRRGASRGRKQEYQGRQPGFKKTGHDTEFFCQYCQCFHKSCKECTKDDENSSRGETSMTSEAFQRKFTARFPGSEPTNQRSFSYQQTQWVNADAKPDTQSTRTNGKSSPFYDHLKTPNDLRKGDNIKKSPSSNRGSFQPTGVSSQGSSTGTRSTTNTENSDAERKSSDTKSKPQPPPCKSFFDVYGDKASSSKDGKREDSIKKNIFGTGPSFPRTGVSSQGSSAGIPNATNTTKSGTERKTPDPKPKSQPPPRNYSFFDLFGDRDKASNFNDGKRENSTGASFPQTGVSSQGRSTGIPNATNTTKSGTERKSPDQKPKPQPSPRNYSFFDLFGDRDKASNFSDAKDDISKNPSKKGSSYPSGIPSEGSGKETQNTTDTTADKSDTKQNPQPGRRSTVYSYSYVNGSNRFTQVPLINNNRSRESSSSAASQQMPANNSKRVPGDGGSARASGDSKAPTEDRDTKDEVKSTNKGQATDQRPNSHSKGAGGPTASKENPTTEGSKAKTSTSVSSMSREAGNMLFRSARDQRSNTIKSFKLKGALKCYTSAYDWSRRDEDLVSAAKNAATTYWRLAELTLKTGGASDEKAIHDYFKDALQYFNKAYPKRNCRGQAWTKHLEKAMQDCFDDIRTWIAPKDEDDRVAALTEYLGYLPACGAKVNGYLYISNIYLKRGKEALKFDEYENCQGYLKECRVPLGEAEKICANVDPSIQLSVDGLKRSVEYHEGLVKRYIARVKDVEARQQRERAEESAKKIAMDQLKVDIKTLDLFTKLPVEDFVKQVYRVWPPKGSNGPNPPSSSSSSSSSVASKKKLLIRALSHYHPDKVDKNVHGIKWHLLSCEITKCLNMRLASIK